MKKLFAILLVVAMLLALAGCAGGETSSDNPSNNSNASVSSSDADPIRIGIWTSLTGASAIEGELIENGARLAAAQWNAKGGINGRQIDFVVYDDQSTTEGAVTATTRLIENDKVDAIIGSNLSNSIVATASLIEEAGIPFVGSGTGTAWTKCGYHYIFRGTVVNSFMNEGFVRVAAEEMVVKNAAFIWVETENGQTACADIKEYCNKYGVNIAYEGTYQSSDTDFTAQVTNTIKANPDGVMLFGLANELSLIVKQLRQAGYNGYIYMAEAGASVDLIDVAGSAADGIIFTAAYVVPPEPSKATSELMKEMLEAYVDMYGEMPATDVAFRVYDGANLLFTAFENAADMNDKDSVRDAFYNIKGYEGIAGTFDYSAKDGDGLSGCNAYMIIGGEYYAFDKATLEKEVPVK